MDLIDPNQTPLDYFVVDATWVSEATIRKINKKYRKKDVVTDVLSFPSPREFAVQGYLGELLLCREQTKRQAKEHGHAFKVETSILLVHGMLHLMGLDHENQKTKAGKQQAKTMQAIEVAVLGQKGLIQRST